MAIIHFFSGTGNTHRAASLIAHELEYNGYSALMHPIESVGPEGSASALHIFAFPVYAFAPPAVMIRYIKTLPPGGAVRTAVLAVFGEVNARGTIPGYEGQALAKAKRMLERRGYDVAVTGAVGYPVSFVQIAGAPSPENQAEISVRGDEKVALLAGRILSGERSLKEPDVISKSLGPLLCPVFALLGRRLLGKLFVADQSCTACGRCIAACPSGTISLRKNMPRWGYRCEGCQRCINACPQIAIQTALARLAMLLAPLFLPYGPWLRGLLGFSPAIFIRVPFDIAAWAVGNLIVVFALDIGLFALQSVPGVRRVVLVNLSHHFRRYLAPGFDPLKMRKSPVDFVRRDGRTANSDVGEGLPR